MEESFPLNLAINIKYKTSDYFIFVILNPQKIFILFLPSGLFQPICNPFFAKTCSAHTAEGQQMYQHLGVAFLDNLNQF